MAEEQSYPPISPYLAVDDGEAALAFYASAFGAEVVERYDYEGKIGHATLKIGGGYLMMSDEFPEQFAKIGVKSPKTLGGTTMTVNLTVGDVDAGFQRALDAGAVTLRAPADEFYGRHGKLKDPFGHVWSLVGPKTGG